MDDETWMKWTGTGPLSPEGNDFRPGNDWGAVAGLLVHLGASRALAVDLVIIHYLKARSLRPLAALFHYGCAPSPGVLHLVASLIPGPTADDRRPFEITMVARKGSGRAGRLKSPENAVRDWFLAHEYERRKGESGGKQFAVVEDMAAELDGVSEDMIERAVTEWKDRSLRDLLDGWSNSELKKLSEATSSAVRSPPKRVQQRPAKVQKRKGK